MADAPSVEALQIAQRWCEEKGLGWSVRIDDPLGQGGTAPVFEIDSPDGARALKVYASSFSSGEKGDIERKRIEQQCALKGHNCPFLVQVHEGGEFDGRLYVLMSRAPGTELEKRLGDVPRDKIRAIVDQIAQAAIFLASKGFCHRDIKAANIFISDDFDHATLLDTSVIRDISDPMGVGTDHDGRLPVVATARYSPPEYLFRLVEPGPRLWHALDVYQLGALLHDLIMREPLFQAEYLKCADNRYRFAWIVATTIPKLQAEDVDEDLIFSAARALDKDWERRSALRLEDFLADSATRQSRALGLLGMSSDQAPLLRNNNISEELQLVRQLADKLENAIREHLRRFGVTAMHEVKPGPEDTSKLLIFRWDAPAPAQTGPRRIMFQVLLRLLRQVGRYAFETAATLTDLDATKRQVSLQLPTTSDDPGFELRLANHVESALAELAVAITESSTGKGTV